MGKKSTTFEVQGLRDGRWVFDTRFDNEAQARTRGVDLLAEGECEGIRIVKDWARSDGKHVESEIHVEYAQKKESIAVEKVDDAPVCEALEDYYAFEARLTVGQLLRNYVGKVGATPTELMHSYSEFRRLEAYDNVLVAAVARVASAQAAKLEVDSTVRRNVLYEVIGRIAARARDAEAEPGLPSLRETDFARAFERIAARKPQQIRFYTNVMVCRELVQTRNLLGKLELLLKWMPQVAGLPSEATRIMDGLVSDVVCSPTVFHELIGEQRSLAHALCAMVDLSHGRFTPAGRVGTDLSSRLNEIAATGALEDTRKALLFNVARLLRGTTALNRHDPNGEPAAFEQVLRHLLHDKGVVGGGPMAEALVRRFLRFVPVGGAAGMRQAIRGAVERIPDAKGQVRFLISLFESELAKDHAEDVLAQLDGICADSRRPAGFVDANQPLKNNLEQLTALHEFVLGSPLPADNRTRLSDRIDDMLVSFITGNRIVERLDKPEDPLRHRAIRLLQLCAPGVLRSPKALNVVRARVVDHLRQPNFDAKYVEDIADAAQRERVLRDLKGMLERAGLR